MSITFEKVLVLKNIPMFESASEMALSDLIAASEEKTYKAGDVIVDNEKENSFLFIVLLGKAAVVQEGETIQEFASRQIFGETTVLSPAVLPYPIKALEKTIVLKTLTPTAWPAVLGKPRCFAQRPFPSIIMPT